MENGIFVAIILLQSKCQLGKVDWNMYNFALSILSQNDKIIYSESKSVADILIKKFTFLFMLQQTSIAILLICYCWISYYVNQNHCELELKAQIWIQLSKR